VTADPTLLRDYQDSGLARCEPRAVDYRRTRLRQGEWSRARQFRLRINFFRTVTTSARVQELLGYREVSTTMIYTHVLNASVPVASRLLTSIMHSRKGTCSWLPASVMLVAWLG